MKKIDLILITLFAVIGALLIYNHLNTGKTTNINNKIINEEYSLLTNSIIVNKSIDEINNTIDKASDIIFICIYENEWCNYYAKNLNNVSVDNEINEISYLNIKQDRQYNTAGYRKLVNKLKDYLIKDDENNLRVFVPTTIFVKNGKIIAYDNETSMISENILPSEYWTDEKTDEFKQKIASLILEYKEEQ